jgi:hypothetical protein
VHLEPGTVVDRYTVESVLGTGGMAVVYRVRHVQLGSLHAMKVLEAPTRAIRARLLQEGRVQSTLAHPNVVAVTDVVEVGDDPALVMEYVRGPSLAGFLEKVRPTLDQADELARGVLAGVAAAHRFGLVHRDLKPANILLSLASGAPVPKIADFGLAKLLDGDRQGLAETRSGVRMGTPLYMAPEQVRDAKAVDARADLWATGVVLYELVTGRRPFQGGDVLEVFTAVCAGTYVPADELVDRLPERMSRAISAALTVDPARRVADCGELLALWTGEDRRIWDVGAFGAFVEPAARSVPPADEQTWVQPSHALDVAKRPEAADRPCWFDAVVACNAASRRDGLREAYVLGPWEQRREYGIDDLGRMLYGLIPFARIAPVLARFGTDTLRVVQLEPERLCEVSGIGPKTVAALKAAWDPWKYGQAAVTWDRAADGWRLPTEAEWLAAKPGFEAMETWEWAWDEGAGGRVACGDGRRVIDARTREIGLGFRVARG